ncbi:dephospho-CoA kinase [Alteromonas sp. ASW11-36]|uniref:Dephospho-CoA kinase n=1 Tax=Alteromonas arenosi TaxID=3055817 RepID=A0ABT7SVH0_9ALTE|nr:dephospho-CoA kinase [Alteromonas sp. ASW11-36]MDM7859544.1 dephospho-CoA kinase [Alteromonas sp. ASW11-36]
MSQYVVGLTGGIGSGKTAVSDSFTALGIDVVDADVCARQVVEPGNDALAQIASRFGEEILLADGHLNRAALRQRVFQNTADKEWLNALLHPLIRAQMITQIAAATSPYCILVAPLLLENNMQSMVNRVLVVDVAPEQQLARVVARDNSDEATIKAIMRAQLDREERLAKADDVIVNDASLNALKIKVQQLHNQYLRLAANLSKT